MSPEVARNGPPAMSAFRSLSGVNRTWRGHRQTDANDPTRTSDRLDPRRKIAYAALESVGAGVGHEATQVHHSGRRAGSLSDGRASGAERARAADRHTDAFSERRRFSSSPRSGVQ